jgi:hypothetical protein
MEGLKRWVIGERDGYKEVFNAVDATGYLSKEETLSAVGKR